MNIKKAGKVIVLLGATAALVASLAHDKKQKESKEALEK